LGIGHRGPKIDLRGKMENDIGVCACDDADELWRLKIGPQECEAARAKPVVAMRLLEIGRDAAAEVINSNYIVAFSQQSVHQGGSDESGGAGNQASHDLLLLFNWTATDSSR
jgi:hypothetical protein